MRSKLYTKLAVLLISTLTLASCDSESVIAIKEYGEKVGIDGQKSDSYKYGEITLDSNHTVSDSILIISNSTKNYIEATFRWETDSVYENNTELEYLNHYEIIFDDVYAKLDSTKLYHENDLKTFDDVSSTSFGRNMMVLKYGTYNLSNERKKIVNKIQSYSQDLKLTSSLLTHIKNAKTQLQRLTGLNKESTLVEFYSVPIVGLGVYQYNLIKTADIYQVSNVTKTR